MTAIYSMCTGTCTVTSSTPWPVTINLGYLVVIQIERESRPPTYTVVRYAKASLVITRRFSRLPLAYIRGTVGQSSSAWSDNDNV